MKKTICNIFLISLVLLATGTRAAVLGIDFGSQYFKISLNAPKKQFLIVENTTSNRKTTNAISFYNNERVYDRDASFKQPRNPENTFVFLDKFLGALESDQETFQVAKQFYEEYVLQFDPERGTVIFELKRFTLNDPDAIITLSVEEVVGMILNSAKVYAEKMAEIPKIRDCVITVPINWTLRQRVALVQAARIAGLSPLALIHDNTAAALHFGITRLPENATSTVLFYNIGATNIQASLVEYSYFNNTIISDSQKSIPVITVLADYGIKNVGGYAYDLLLAQHFAKIIDSKPERSGKPSFQNNRRGMVKLLKECNKAKEILSANRDFTFFSEGLLEGNDFSSHITRNQFEEIAADLFSQVTKPIEMVLQKANKTIDDVEMIELIGGGIRIPRIQSLLSEYFDKKELGFHLNGDESMALGAAFQAANFSSAFRVKKIQLNDGYNFDIRLVIQDLDPIQEFDEEGNEVLPFRKEHVIFPIKTRFNTKKTIALKHDKDLSIQVFAKSDEQDLYLAQYNITNITQLSQKQQYKESGKPKVHLSFEIGSINTIDLIEAYATLNITRQVAVESLKDDIKVEQTQVPNDGEEGDTPYDEEQTNSTGDGENVESSSDFEAQQNQEDAESGQQSQNEEQTHQQNEESSQSQGEEQSQQSNEEQSQPQNEEEPQLPKDESSQEQSNEPPQAEGEQQIDDKIAKKLKTKTKIVEFDLDIQKDYPFFKPLNQTQVEKSIKYLKKFDSYEEKIKKTAHEKNSLESFIYQVREQVEDKQFKRFSLQEEREKASTLADESSQWLDSDESFGVSYEDYKRKLTALKNSVKPIQNRINEYNKRPAVLNSTITKLTDYASKVQKLNKTMNWVTDAQKAPIIKLLSSAKEWINEKVNQQEQLQISDDPAFTTQELEEKVSEVKREFEKIKKIKKPKEEKKSEKKEEKTKSEGDSSSKKNKKEQSEDKTDL